MVSQPTSRGRQTGRWPGPWAAIAVFTVSLHGLALNGLAAEAFKSARLSRSPDMLLRSSAFTVHLAATEAPSESAQTDTAGSSEATDKTKTAAASEEESKTDSAEFEKKKRVAGITGALVLVLIGILGVMAIAFCVYLSRRTRRLVRQDPAAPTAYDPLWYLQTQSGSSKSERSAADDPPGTDRPNTDAQGPSNDASPPPDDGNSP